jgi:hypothetical protein
MVETERERERTWQGREEAEDADEAAIIEEENRAF